MMRARMYRPSDEADLVRLASAAMPGWARLRYDYAAGYAAAEQSLDALGRFIGGAGEAPI